MLVRCALLAVLLCGLTAAAGHRSAMAPPEDRSGDAGSAAASPMPGNGSAVLYAAWRPLLAAELRRDRWRPRPQDLYKFLHQGVLGPAHAMDDTAAVRNRLQREWDAVRELPLDGRPALLQPLRPDGQLVRVDLVRLRHLLAAGGPLSDRDEAAALDALTLCFIGTAAAWPLDMAAMGVLWGEVLADSLLWADHFTGHAMAELHDLVATDWPAVRHSEVYRRHAAPHYRVVAADRLPEAWRRAAHTP